jgi:adenosyl cobinamide kinase/adenosyl cobinamide phosphate guanylyltransferase
MSDHQRRSKNWQKIDSYEDIISILEHIDECQRFIMTHVDNANPWDVTVNLRQIMREAQEASDTVERLKEIIGDFRNQIERDIKK